MEYEYVIVCLYIDDMFIIDSDDKIITSTKTMFNSRFEMKDMRIDNVILGIKLIRTSHIMLIIFLKSLIKTIMELPEHQLM